MKKLLICGANGQLGVELQSILASGVSDLGAIPGSYQGAQVVCTDVEELDITDAEETLWFIRENAFDLIINCAAMTNVDGCEEREEIAYRINAVGPMNLAKAAQASGAKLVQISTDYVFSGDDNKEYAESDPVGPQSAYGRTKLAGELLALENCDKTFVIRTAWLFGARGPNFVLTMIDLARKNGQITVVNDQSGNPTYAHDLAYAVLCIADTSGYGVYHCTNKGVCSWFDFASAIVDEAGIECKKTPCTTEEFLRPAKRPVYSPLKNKRLADGMGDKMRNWQDALSVYVERLKADGVID
ncbi:MAG: dTDP-4-dehydrorhamnose reductase [Coriobacteriia bacterium]|nr:dTDP-4-dehydrorhamnose reductase [Coriobacteriia bacterium]MCL2749539.1 dTDP-4-dehydrorhamnose reductase [Coriobacteriia bacterium]